MTRGDATAARPAAVLEAAGLEKRFGGVRALRGAHLTLAPGRVHGLLGQNGSGKSTLLGILSGQLAPDAGTLRIDGRPVRLANPARALAAGVAIVSQELTLAPDLSVTENVCLARREPRRWHGVAWRAMRARTVATLDVLGLSVDPSTPVGALRPDEQQLVEIGRALSTQARILILDEPTSSLTDDEVAHLFSVLRTLRARGVAIVLVTHRTSEILELVDDVTVLRDGEVVVAGAPLGELDTAELVALMSGMRTSVEEAPTSAHRVAEPLLRVRELRIPRVLAGVDLDVAGGEIVGVAGLTGSGRSELLAAIFGVHASTGEIRFGDDVCARLDPRRAMAAGVAYVPPDRKRQGLLLNMAVRDNVALAGTARLTRLRRPRRARERLAAGDALADVGVVGVDPERAAATLSGGNQQKVLLAKWLVTQPRLLLLDDPTRGVDAGAKAEIHQLLARARNEGLAILVSSSEASELRALCDRVIVLQRGRVTAQLAAADVTEASLLHHTMG